MTNKITETCSEAFDEWFEKMNKLKEVVESGDEAQVKEHFDEMNKISAIISDSLNKLKNNPA